MLGSQQEHPVVKSLRSDLKISGIEKKCCHLTAQQNKTHFEGLATKCMSATNRLALCRSCLRSNRPSGGRSLRPNRLSGRGSLWSNRPSRENSWGGYRLHHCSWVGDDWDLWEHGRIGELCDPIDHLEGSVWDPVEISGSSTFSEAFIVRHFTTLYR